LELAFYSHLGKRIMRRHNQSGITSARIGNPATWQRDDGPDMRDTLTSARLNCELPLFVLVARRQPARDKCVTVHARRGQTVVSRFKRLPT
jgi:hypothetical protein